MHSIIRSNSVYRSTTALAALAFVCTSAIRDHASSFDDLFIAVARSKPIFRVETQLQHLDYSLSEIKYLSLVVKAVHCLPCMAYTGSDIEEFYSVLGYGEHISTAAHKFPHSARQRLLELLRSRR